MQSFGVPILLFGFVLIFGFAIWLEGTGWPHIKDDDK